MNEAAATLEARDARIEALERQLADTEHWRQYWARHYEDVEERLDATEADRDRLAAKNAKLKGFAKAAMILSWEGYTIDGLTFQDLAEEHGVIRRVSYDPTEHGPSDIEPGEPWFVLSDALFEPQGDEHG
jgi:hypothetical protein